MPRLADLLTQQELDLLRLVPLPVPLAEFLQAEFAGRITVDRLLYSLFSQIPGARVTPVEGDYSYVSPYTDYAGWLKWFLAHRQPSQRRRGGDIDLQRALTQAQLDRAGTASLPQNLEVRPHVWADYQTPPRDAPATPRARRPRQRTQNPLEQPIQAQPPRQESRNPLGGSLERHGLGYVRVPSQAGLYSTPEGEIVTIVRVEGRFAFDADGRWFRFRDLVRL